MAECTLITVPVHHEEQGGAVIKVAVKRKLGKIPNKRQLWFLDGGPGDSGRESLTALVKAFSDSDDLDLYTFDHRGVGGTQLLDCPEQQSPDSEGGREIVAKEWKDCIQYLQEHRDDLDVLTTTETAQDLGLLVELFREPNAPVFIMGVSYGTYLANRYLQLFPHQPDGVILDGLVPADWSFSEFDRALDQVGRKFLAECDNIPDCADHFRSDLTNLVLELIEDLEAGRIDRLGLTADMLKLLLGNMLMIDSTRPYIPAFLIRLERFSWYDKMAILHLFRLFSKDDGIAAESPFHSQVLQRHISISEIWGEDAPALKKLEEDLAGYIMTTRVSTAFAATAANWPIYNPGSLDDTTADYDGPLLMLHGGLDPTVPPERLEGMRHHFSAPNQHFVLFPQGGHVVINDNSCARLIYQQFLDSPTQVPDISCVSEIPSLSFFGDEKITELLFGSKDFWGNQITWNMQILKLLFHTPAIVVAVIFLLVGAFIIRKTSHNAKAQKPYFRMTVAAIIWVMVFFLWRLGGIILPYLFDYRAIHTIALVLILVLLQIVIGVFLLRWVRRSPPLKTDA
ncbi:alpha/beta fold hydrolase [Acidobacteriota bacterium]